VFARLVLELARRIAVVRSSLFLNGSECASNVAPGNPSLKYRARMLRDPSTRLKSEYGCPGKESDDAKQLLRLESVISFDFKSATRVCTPSTHKADQQVAPVSFHSCLRLARLPSRRETH